MAGVPLPVHARALSAVVAAAAKAYAGLPGMVQLVQGPAPVNGFPIADEAGPAPGLPRGWCPKCEVNKRNQAMLRQHMAADIASLQAGVQQPADAAAVVVQLLHDRERLQLSQEYAARHEYDVEVWQAYVEEFRDLAREQRAALPQGVQQQAQPWASTNSTFMVHIDRKIVSKIPSAAAGIEAAGLPQHEVEVVGVADLVSDETYLYLVPRGPGYDADVDLIANVLLLDALTRLNGERGLVLVCNNAGEMHCNATVRLLQLLVDLRVVRRAQVSYLPAYHGKYEADAVFEWTSYEVHNCGALMSDHLAAIMGALPGVHARILNPAACAAVDAWGRAHYSSPMRNIRQLGHIIADKAWEGKMLLRQAPLGGNVYYHRARAAPFQLSWLDDMQRRPAPAPAAAAKEAVRELGPRGCELASRADTLATYDPAAGECLPDTYLSRAPDRALPADLWEVLVHFQGRGDVPSLRTPASARLPLVRLTGAACSLQLHCAGTQFDPRTEGANLAQLLRAAASTAAGLAQAL